MYFFCKRHRSTWPIDAPAEGWMLWCAAAAVTAACCRWSLLVFNFFQFPTKTDKQLDRNLPLLFCNYLNY